MSRVLAFRRTVLCEFVSIWLPSYTVEHLILQSVILQVSHSACGGGVEQAWAVTKMTHIASCKLQAVLQHDLQVQM